MAGVKTVVYFSSKYISIVRGRTDAKTNRVSVLAKAQTEMPDGAVVNGVLNDEDALASAFKAMLAKFERTKRVELVLDTTHIIHRLAVLPKCSPMETDTLVKNEFINRNMADKEYIYDYAVIKRDNLTNKQQMVLACAIDKSIIDTYRAFFTRVGLVLVRADFSSNAVIQAASALPDAPGGRNTLICVVDHYIVSIINFLSNGEIFFHRTRILSGENDERYFREISDIVRSYIQGRRSLNRSEEYESIYVFDGNVYAPDTYAAQLTPLGFKAVNAGVGSLFSVDGLIDSMADSFAYCLTALFSSPSKNLNLLEIRKYTVLTGGQKKGLAGALVIGAAAVGVAVYLLTTYASIGLMNMEIDEKTAFMLDPDVRRDIADYGTLTSDIAALNEAYDQAAAVTAVTGSSAIIKSEVMYAVLDVFKESELHGIAFSAADGTVTVNLSLTRPELISVYVGDLRASGLFNDVAYSGYAGSENAYNYQVTGAVKEMKEFD